MKLIRNCLAATIAMSFVVGCGGGGATDVAKKLLKDKTLYNCKGDNYSKNIFLDDKLNLTIYKVSDDSEVASMDVDITYSGENLSIDADGGIKCKITEKEGYIEGECIDGSDTNIIQLYNTKEEAKNNCL